MIGYVNIRGIRGSVHAINKISEGYDILLFQETKLADDASFTLEGFSFPVGAIHSGLAIACRDNSNFTVRLLDSSAFNSRDRQVQLIEVNSPRLNTPVTLANIYIRCDSAPTDKHWHFLQDLEHNFPHLIIMGDFNARHPTWDASGGNRNGAGLHCALDDLDLYLLNTGEPTRLAERFGDPDTVIDLTLASADLRDRTEWDTAHHLGSDHLMCDVAIRYHLTAAPVRNRQPYKGIKDCGIWGKLRRLSRSTYLNNRTFKRSNPPIWWNQKVDTAWKVKNTKDRALRRCRAGTPGFSYETFMTARLERNKATAMFKRSASSALQQRWDHLCDQANLNTAQFWKFHSSLDRRRTPHNSVMFDEDNNILSTIESQAQAFLNRFIKQSEHGDTDARSLVLIQLSQLVNNAEPDTDLTVDEVSWAITVTKKGAPGPDAINISAFKQLSDKDKQDLTSAYNKSWKTGKIPHIWTDSYIGPVPKPAKDHRYIRGHRIITCQNVMGKIPEKIVARRLATFVDPLLPKGLGGYRPGRETWINAAAFASDTWEGFESCQDTLAVALDLEDAYNRVRLPTLVDKMLHLGISVQCTRWVLAALSTRRCILKYKDWRSDWVSINMGLPQGSPLSPVLFNIYTAGLANLDRPLAHVKTFADDVLVYTCGNSSRDILDRVQPQLSRIERCCQMDGNEINADKAAALYCTLRTRILPEDVPVPSYGGSDIIPGQSLKYLGVVFDPRLSFTNHVNTMLQRVSRGVNALRAAAGRKAQERHLLMLYTSLVLSVIDYALPMLQLSLNQLNRLERVQNTCLRIVTGCTRSTPISALHFLTSCSSISYRQQIARAILISKALQINTHGLHDSATSYLAQCTVRTADTYTLRPRNTRTCPRRRLTRKSWLDASFEAMYSLAGDHAVSHNPMWSTPDDSPSHTVIIRFNRECRDWPEGKADKACTALFQELGVEEAILLATDGSFTAGTNRAGWAFVAYHKGVRIAQDSGAHTIYTSSTRMEIEAVSRALLWLRTSHPDANKAIIATDSMALLSRIKAGWVPYGWISPAEAPVMGRLTWVYVPGHAGVAVNEEADRLAGLDTGTSPLPLYFSDFQLLGSHTSKTQTTSDLQHSSEGQRLCDLAVKFGCSASSKRFGKARVRHNQILTGNLSLATLRHLLLRGDMG